MGRSYQQIKNGKFFGKSFDMNVSGTIYMGKIMCRLGFILTEERAPHEITGQLQEDIKKFLCQKNHPELIRSAIEKVNEARCFSQNKIQDDVDWVVDFFNLAWNKEGFASDYCMEYF